MSKNDVVIWQQVDTSVIPATAKTPMEITSFAQQLSKRDQHQVVAAFQSQSYEMAIGFVWLKTISALKRVLSTLGMQFVGEMLNNPEITENDDIDVITEKDALRLAEELGIVSQTEGIRLRHVQEIITHLSQLETTVDNEEIVMDELEALNALKVCVKNILGRPKVDVATKFVEFRAALESASLTPSDPRVVMLISSPYFFHKLTINILLSVVKTSIGAKLENALANLNLILPLLWGNLRDTERWQVGNTYRDLYANGQTTAVGGLQSVLLKVKGFDYVPENLRSNTFIFAAENLIRAHEGLNNFYNEESPMRTLSKLGSTIPAPAFPVCASAILSVRLGNRYGISWAALPFADRMLDEFTKDRWSYYLNQCLPGDIRILQKLDEKNPRANWFNLISKYDLKNIEFKNKLVEKLVKSSADGNADATSKAQIALIQSYYGKPRNS